jgi:hypothetical protein
MHLLRFFTALCALLFVTACRPRETASTAALNPISPATPAPAPPAVRAQPPKIGGIYANKYSDGTYQIVKVLAVDDLAVHVRVYADKPNSLPTSIDTSKLDVMVGHAPVERAIFDQEQSTLLKVEDVTDPELEGYRVYLETQRAK